MSAERQLWVTSPDGQLHFNLVDEAGGLRYVVQRGTDLLICRGRLGIDRTDSQFSHGLRINGQSEQTEHVDDYELIVGKRRGQVAHYRQRTFHLVNDHEQFVDIIVRSYNDGVAFRYRFPDQSAEPHQVIREHSSFALEGAVCWLQPQEPPARATPAYEANYTNALPISDAQSSNGWTMPALFRADEQWTVVAEASVDETFCGCRLDSARDGEFTLLLPQVGEGNNVGIAEPVSTLPWCTPWRLIITSSDLATVAESCLVTHLNPPSQIADTSWIQPGRVAWSWWSDNASPRLPQKLREFVDFAAEMGWEHHLIDANWNLVPETEIRELIDYASSIGVGTFLWYNSGGPNNVVEEQPRDRMTERKRRRQEFAEIASWGVAGVKIDFFHSDNQERITAYRSILQDAADAKLMVNFHGCTAPRGWEREWPNLMTMEAVRGAEQYQAQPGYPEEAPVLHTIFPFTRNLVGSMDYTPVTFSDNTYPHRTTGAFELALCVLIESGLQHFADSPAAYRALPAPALQALADVPATWDDTILVDGYPGRHCVIARRAGDAWWIASVNGSSKPLDLELDLTRLGLRPGDQLQVLHDGPTPSRDGLQIISAMQAIDSRHRLSVSLPGHGGALARTRPHVAE